MEIGNRRHGSRRGLVNPAFPLRTTNKSTPTGHHLSDLGYQSGRQLKLAITGGNAADPLKRQERRQFSFDFVQYLDDFGGGV